MEERILYHTACRISYRASEIVLDVKNSTIIAAEGNISNTNMSGIIERPLDEHIRAYIRIPNGYQYKMTSVDRGGEE